MSKYAKQLITPDGEIVYYPTGLHSLAEEEVYTIFHTMSLSTMTGHLYATTPNGIKHLKSGDPFYIEKLYEEIPWRERTLSNESGIFFYKEAPSYDELEKLIKELTKE